MPGIASQQDASSDDALMQAHVEGDVSAFETPVAAIVTSAIRAAAGWSSRCPRMFRSAA